MIGTPFRKLDDNFISMIHAENFSTFHVTLIVFNKETMYMAQKTCEVER